MSGKTAVFGTIAILAIFTGVVEADAVTVMLPQTGLSTCYAEGNPLNCATTGQDGDKQAGVPWPDPRFSVGDGAEAECVTDHLTGLTWMRTPNSSEVIWQEALDFARTSTLCGFSDWRVPSILELESLVHAGYYEEMCGGSACNSNSQWLMSQGFQLVASGMYQYWSATSFSAYGSPDYAWAVQMGPGYVNVQRKTGMSAELYGRVWPVRDSGLPAPAKVWRTGQNTCYNAAGDVVTCGGTGQDGELKPGAAWPVPRFADNGNGTVTDNLTGLIWLKDANCFGAITWPIALAHANGLMSGECGLTDGSTWGDWRLPNRKELLSLIDFEYYDPALSNTVGDGQWLAGDAFQSPINLQYWSSTAIGWHGYPLYVSTRGEVLYHVPDPYGASFGFWPVRSVPYRNLLVSETGAGVVTSTPPGIDCGSTCSAYFPLGKAVSLLAVPSSSSATFHGWSGDADCSDGKVSMNADRQCTATFTFCLSVSPARIGSTTYPSLDAAYHQGASLFKESTIELVGYVRAFPTGYDFDANKRVVLKGGLNCTYAPVNGGFTYFTGGPFVISKGTVTFDRIVIM